MPALAPTITQTAPTDQPCPPGTKVADLSTGAGETDPGPFTYAVSTGGTNFSVTAAELFAAADLSGANGVGVTVTGSDATASPETQATITVGEATTTPAPGEDGYVDNAQFPPQLEGGAVENWDMFIVAATNAVVPRARNGVDFVVARPDKYSPMTNVSWDDTVLGPRPDAEIEAEARRLAAEWPADVSPV